MAKPERLSPIMLRIAALSANGEPGTARKEAATGLLEQFALAVNEGETPDPTTVRFLADAIKRYLDAPSAGLDRAVFGAVDAKKGERRGKYARDFSLGDWGELADIDKLVDPSAELDPSAPVDDKLLRLACRQIGAQYRERTASTGARPQATLRKRFLANREQARELRIEADKIGATILRAAERLRKAEREQA